MILDSTSVRAFLGVPSGDDDRLTIAMGYAERAAARYCGRDTFEHAWYTRTFDINPNRIALNVPVRPLVAPPAVCFDDLGFAFTGADVTTGTPGVITFTGHELTVGDGPFRFVAQGQNAALPTGLDSATDYWISAVDGADFEVTDTEGGSSISITTGGTNMTRMVGPMEPRASFVVEPEAGIIVRAGRIQFPPGWPVVVVFKAGVCADGNDAPDDLFGALVEQAAFRFIQGGLSGRLGEIAQQKPSGVVGTYVTTEWAPGVLSVLDRYRLLRLG